MIRRLLTHINLHFLIESVVHNEAVGHSNPVRLHGMSSNIGVIPNIRVVEVGDFLLISPVHRRLVKWGKGGHGDSLVQQD